MEEFRTLKELEGTTIALLAPLVFNHSAMERVRLHAVEGGGIWIESQMLTDTTLNASGATMAERTLVFFLPWHQIYWVMSSIDVPSISGQAAQL
jgi:hypothetical protein